MNAPVLDLRILPRLRTELDNLRETYAVQRDQLRAMPSGRARGMAGHQLSAIGKKGRALAAKVAWLEAEAMTRGVLV